MIEWQNKYEIGVPEIDEQHRWIFDFVNGLEQQLKLGDKGARIDEVLESLNQYAKRHFNYEEGCMLKWKCPVAAQNKKAHDNFIFAYENFMERYKREGHSDDLAWKIHDMVEDWITNHICLIDMKLKNCQK